MLQERRGRGEAVRGVWSGLHGSGSGHPHWKLPCMNWLDFITNDTTSDMIMI